MIELLIAIAIIGIVSAFAVPVYRSYLDTANTSKINAAFQNAVRVAQEEYAKSNARVAMGLPSTLPRTRREWIARFDAQGTQAPGGGPIYETKGAMGDPDDVGSIMVEYDSDKSALLLRRPAYLNLKAVVARVDASGVSMMDRAKN